MVQRSVRRSLTKSAATAGFIIALILSLSGCANNKPTPAEIEQQAFDDLRTEIRNVVDDPQRATAAVEIVDELEADLADLRERIATRKRRVRELNADYDTPREEFEVYLNQVAREVREHRNQMSATYQHFLDLITEDERLAIGKAKTRAMNSAVLSIQST
jgi:uncharacterized coiled-coil DUF342 family protein